MAIDTKSRQELVDSITFNDLLDNDELRGRFARLVAEHGRVGTWNRIVEILLASAQGECAFKLDFTMLTIAKTPVAHAALPVYQRLAELCEKHGIDKPGLANLIERLRADSAPVVRRSAWVHINRMIVSAAARPARLASDDAPVSLIRGYAILDGLRELLIRLTKLDQVTYYRAPSIVGSETPSAEDRFLLVIGTIETVMNRFEAEVLGTKPETEQPTYQESANTLLARFGLDGITPSLRHGFLDEACDDLRQARLAITRAIGLSNRLDLTYAANQVDTVIQRMRAFEAPESCDAAAAFALAVVYQVMRQHDLTRLSLTSTLVTLRRRYGVAFVPKSIG